MKVEIFSILDYYGNKNNESEMLSMYLEHYKKRFPSCTINIYMSNYPENYDGYELQLLYKYGCNINNLKLGDNRNYYDSEKRNYVKEDKAFMSYIELETNFKNTIWKNSNADWVIVCDIDELLMISDKDLKNINHHVIRFKGYNMVKFNNMSKINVLTHGFRWDGYDKCSMFKPSLENINYTIGQHTANPSCNNNKILNDKYLLLHYNKNYFLYPKKYFIGTFEYLRTELSSELTYDILTKNIFNLNISF